MEGGRPNKMERGIKGRRGFRERREWAKERGNKGKRWGYIWGMWGC